MITIKKEIKRGMLVDIVSEEDKGSSSLTRGYVVEILSQSNSKKGIKVKLQSGCIGKVEHIVTKDELRLDNFKFYNRFFFKPKLFTIYDNENRSFMTFDHVNQVRGTLEKTALLFDEESLAKNFVKGTVYDNKRYLIRSIQRYKLIVDLFSSCGAEYFRINVERKLSKGKLLEWENYFKNMR